MANKQFTQKFHSIAEFRQACGNQPEAKKSLDEPVPVRLVVQFCPCGHTSRMAEPELRQLVGNQLTQIRMGEKLDAPILPSEMCPECQQAQFDRECRLSWVDWD